MFLLITYGCDWRILLAEVKCSAFTVSILEWYFFYWGISMKVGSNWIIAGFYPHPKVETEVHAARRG